MPLKVNIFIWRLFLNRLAIKMNLFRRNILDYPNTLCMVVCSLVEDWDHFFFSCAIYGQLWLLTSGWLDISTTFHGSLLDHFIQFGCLGGFLNKSHRAFNIIWIEYRFFLLFERIETGGFSIIRWNKLSLY